MAELHNGDKSKLEVSPNLWAGVGLVRGGAGTALVGDPQTVADRIQEYADLGINTFIFQVTHIWKSLFALLNWSFLYCPYRPVKSWPSLI